jgi:hypothetical protein
MAQALTMTAAGPGWVRKAISGEWADLLRHLTKGYTTTQNLGKGPPVPLREKGSHLQRAHNIADSRMQSTLVGR